MKNIDEPNHLSTNVDGASEAGMEGFEDRRWSMPWFGATEKPNAFASVSGSQSDETSAYYPFATTFSSEEAGFANANARKHFNTLSGEEYSNRTVRPQSFAEPSNRAVTPYEVIADLREALAQHVYLDGLRPWLRDTGQGARGGISRIHFLSDDLVHREVAMKALDGNRGRPIQELGLLKEALITGQLAHPCIPPVHDLWMSPSGECRFTMKKIDGRTLSELVASQPPGQRTRAEFEAQLQIVVRVCDALSYAHHHGVLHRDVKPSNVMVGNHGEVFLMDWGCALASRKTHFPKKLELPRALIEALKCQDDAIVGTPSFMPPEQACGDFSALDAASDVYLLGGLLYFVLTGIAPRARIFGAQDAIRAAQDGFIHNPFLASPDAELPAKLMEITRRALDPSPQRRFPTARAFQGALRAALRDGMWLSTLCCSKGQTIYAKGDAADAVYLIQDGAVEAYQIERGTKVNAAILGSGEVFGEAAFFNDGRRNHTVEAYGDVTLVRVPKEVFEEVLAPGSSLHRIIAALSSRNLGSGRSS